MQCSFTLWMLAFNSFSSCLVSRGYSYSFPPKSHFIFVHFVQVALFFFFSFFLTPNHSLSAFKLYILWKKGSVYYFFGMRSKWAPFFFKWLFNSCKKEICNYSNSLMYVILEKYKNFEKDIIFFEKDTTRGNNMDIFFSYFLLILLLPMEWWRGMTFVKILRWWRYWGSC